MCSLYMAISVAGLVVNNQMNGVIISHLNCFYLVSRVNVILTIHHTVKVKVFTAHHFVLIATHTVLFSQAKRTPLYVVQMG